MKKLIAAMLAAAALAGAPKAHAEGPDPNAAPDVAGFLQGLQILRLEKSRDSAFMVATAHGICNNLRDGQNALEVARSIQSSGSWSPHDAWATISSAAWFICPDMFATFSRQQAAARAAGDNGAPQRPA